MRKKTKIKKVKVPLHYQPPGGRPKETLAYISPEERRMLLANTDGQANMTAQKLLSFYMDYGTDTGGHPSMTDDTGTTGGSSGWSHDTGSNTSSSSSGGGGLGSDPGDHGFGGATGGSGAPGGGTQGSASTHDTGSNMGGLGADTGPHGFAGAMGGSGAPSQGGVRDGGFRTNGTGQTTNYNSFGSGGGQPVGTPPHDGGFRTDGTGQQFNGYGTDGGQPISEETSHAIIAATETIHANLDGAGFYGPGVPDPSYFGNINDPRKGQYTAPGRGNVPSQVSNQTLNKPDVQAQIDRSYYPDVNTPVNTRASANAGIAAAVRGLTPPAEGKVAGVTSPNPINDIVAGDSLSRYDPLGGYVSPNLADPTQVGTNPVDPRIAGGMSPSYPTGPDYLGGNPPKKTIADRVPPSVNYPQHGAGYAVSMPSIQFGHVPTEADYANNMPPITGADRYLEGSYPTTGRETAVRYPSTDTTERTVRVDPVPGTGYDPLHDIQAPPRINVASNVQRPPVTVADWPGDIASPPVSSLPDGTIPIPRQKPTRVPVGTTSPTHSPNPVEGPGGLPLVSDADKRKAAVEAWLRNRVQGRINNGLIGGAYHLITGHNIWDDQAPSQGGGFGIGGGAGGYPGGSLHPGESNAYGWDRRGRIVPKGSATDVSGRPDNKVPPPSPPPPASRSSWRYPNYSQPWAFKNQPDMFGGVY